MMTNFKIGVVHVVPRAPAKPTGKMTIYRRTHATHGVRFRRIDSEVGYNREHTPSLVQCSEVESTGVVRIANWLEEMLHASLVQHLVGLLEMGSIF